MLVTDAVATTLTKPARRRTRDATLRDIPEHWPIPAYSLLASPDGRVFAIEQVPD